MVTLADHEDHARRCLDDNAWAYFSGGAADEITLRANRSAWDALLLHPRVLRSLVGGHTRIELLGRTWPHPILLAPVAFQRLAHPDGELASAYAAAAQGAGMVLSTQSSTPLEAVASAYLSNTERGPLWFQFYAQHDAGFNLALLQRAEQAGFEAIVMTVVAPCSGARDRERRAGFRLPDGIDAVHLRDMPAPPSVGLQAGQSGMFDHLLKHAPTWGDVAWLQANTHLPILLKGVLHPDDARQAVAMGVQGVIVSNHGGRTLDTVPATAQVLPRIVQAIEGRIPVLVDGGIRRGTDVLKAMALGASAVLVGQPYVYGLANAGAVGVAHVLRLLRDELEIAMALTGCRTLDEAHAGLLFSTD